MLHFGVSVKLPEFMVLEGLCKNPAVAVAVAVAVVFPGDGGWVIYLYFTSRLCGSQK